MSFNIFDYPKNTDITVGYVDPTLGYVTGVSICEANEYAKKNPGTTFIFENRNGIRYLNINEVNKLTPKDLASSAETCTGVQVEGNPDPPQSIFTGGGGVGATGNPVFGKDGSLLAVDLISGGFGYQYPPLVEVRDETGLGVGAVTRSILVGDPEYPDCKFVDTEEVFDQEDDFEEYQICDSLEDVGYGTRYDADGKPVGKWDPKLYATLSRDPIAREIQNYQDFLQKLESPWWTTRKKSPLRVTSGNKTTRIKHDVQHPGWGGEYGQSGSGDFKEVTFNVFTSGAQDKGLAIKFTSEDKSHSFKIKADDFKNDQTGQKVTQKVKVNTVYNISSEGSFRGKPSEKGLISNLGKDAKEKNPTGKDTIVKGTKIFADFVESSNDNDDLQIEATLGQFTSKQIGKGKGRSNFDLKYEFKDSSVFNATKERIDESFMNKYAISPVPPSNAPGSDFAGQEFTMEWEEDFPYEGEYVFRAQADNLGRFYLDNEKLIETTQFKQDKTPKFVKKTVTAGVHKIRIDLYNQPQYDKVIKQQAPTQAPTQAPAPTTAPESVINTPQPTWYPVGPVPLWNTLMDKYAVFPKPGPKNTGVSDNQDHTLTYSINIPKDGQYTLEYAADNYGTWAFDGKVVAQVSPKNGGDGSTFILNRSVKLNLTSGTYPLTMTVKAISGGTLGGVRVAVDSPAGIAWKLLDPSGKIIYTSRDLSATKVNKTISSNVNPPTSSSQSSTQSDLKTQVKKVFNTIDYIDKADRKLWRIDTRAGKDAAFINQYGILPFDITSAQAQTDGFPGTHVIRWEYVDFPVDGNYNIEIQVDDNVTLYIGNRDGGGRVEIGNGLKDINEGGDEVIIRKKGFSGPGKSTGKSLETRFFKAGKYRIRAELEQIDVGPLARNNPMALAINIETAFVEENVISPRSWNENPMGAALTIEAPLPPIPQEPIPPQEGRCPNNPIWTTRFPTSKQKWWPVKFTNQNPNQPSWSRFMNRYAISPIPPLAKKGSDGGGIVYRNEWEIDIPYDGFYAFKSTVDNAGRILVDNQPIMQANYIPVNLRNTRGGSGVEQRSGIEAIDGGIIYNWRENNPKAKKVFLTKGRHTIQIEVENGITETFTKIDKKVFSTKDWLFPPKDTQQTTQQATTQTTDKKIICHAGGGFGGNVDGKKQTNVGVVKVGKGGNGGPSQPRFQGGDSNKGGSAGTKDGKLQYGAFTSLLGLINGRGVQLNGISKNVSKDGDVYGYGGGGNNFFPRIQGTKGSVGGGGDLASNGGNGAVQIKYSGKTQDYTKPGTYEFVVPDGVTSLDIVCIGGGGSGADRNLSAAKTSTSTAFIGGSGGSGGAYAYDTVSVTPGTKFKVVVGAGGATVNKGSKNGEDSYVEIQETFVTTLSTVESTVNVPSTQIINQSPTAAGVVYEGPTPIANYKGDFISPVLQNVNAKPNEEIQGKDWIFRWSNVDFPVDGQYTLESEADDELKVRIDGVEVGKSKVFEGRRKTTFNATKGKKTVELVLSNIRIADTGYEQNPVVGYAQITVPVDVSTGVSLPWTSNPVGISAILIPPPCPKKVTGKGVVCRVIVDDPGNGYPASQGPGYPATLRLKSVEVENPGINYNCGVDQIQISPSNGAELDYECDTFGRITKVKVLNPGLGFNITPEITMVTPPEAGQPTGVNARFRPQFEVVRDPIVVDPQVIIQVTDLVGLKQTGYVDGRPYYGSVFYKNGIRYAGFYQTPGDLVQVYATLQESIDSMVTTPPSAIQRQGTDISSNDPRLNIPGTPDQII